jgi:hypothetical protein
MDPQDFVRDDGGRRAEAIGLSDMGWRPASAEARTVECTAEQRLRSIDDAAGAV